MRDTDPHPSTATGPPPATDTDAAPRRRLNPLPVAIVHDWLLGMRGGEWLLSALLPLFPSATVHTLFYRPDGLDSSINRRSIAPSSLSRLPMVAAYYRWLLPWLPAAVERLPLAADRRLLLSISHCVAHGAIAPPGAVHVSYCLSPMRYLYDQGEAYRRSSGMAGWALGRAGRRLRDWDGQAARRAGHVWAISEFVARRIERAWGRTPSRIVYPPVRTARFTPPAPGAPARRAEALLVSAMVPYKRVDLAIHTANRLRLPLRVVGGGPLLGRLRRLAGPTVAVEGRVGEERLAELYRTCRMLVFPSEEDFGIVPLEAMAGGMPVLGLRAGGLLETHLEGITGAFFDEPTVAALGAAWTDFRPAAYDPAILRAHAEKFSEQRFQNEVVAALDEIGPA